MIVVVGNVFGDAGGQIEALQALRFMLPKMLRFEAIEDAR